MDPIKHPRSEETKRLMNYEGINYPIPKGQGELDLEYEYRVLEALSNIISELREIKGILEYK